MKKLNIALWGFLALFLAGSTVENQEFQIVKKEGITIAINPDHPVPAEHGPRDIIFSEELVLGSASGDPETTFGDFISYTTDPEGNIYILDWMANTVKKFGPDGKHLLTFGRSGQGPGEFLSPREICFLPNRELIIFEGESQRFSVFNTEGVFLRSGRFPKLLVSPYRGFANGNMIATHVQYGPQKTLVTTGIYNTKSELLLLLYQQESPPLQPWPRNDQDARARRFAEIMSRRAFRPSEIVALDQKESIFFAYSDTYEIKVISAAGKLERKIRTELPFRPVTKKDQENFLNIWAPKDISTWDTMSESYRKKIKNLIRFPEKKPAFFEIVPMDNDYFLVLRDGVFGQNAIIDIFDREGRFIIEKELSFPIQNGRSRRNKLYTIYEDENGYQYVKRYGMRFIHKD